MYKRLIHCMKRLKCNKIGCGTAANVIRSIRCSCSLYEELKLRFALVEGVPVT